MKHVMEASHAISEAVKLINPNVVAAYPITPQTHIVERISEYVANGEIDSEYIRVESEFAAMSACLGASATGVRTYTSTSSQGLALMFEVLYIVSGMRLPVCMTLVNRALSAPISIWNDHQDSMAARDTGWIQLYAETAQECHDLTFMQYRISENSDVLLPSMVCLDGFTLSHVYEPFNILSKKDVEDFLPEYKPVHAILDPEQPLTLGPIGFPSHFMEFRKTQDEAMANSLKVMEDVYREFSERFPVQVEGARPEEYGHVEEYLTDDAEIVFVALGSVCGTIKDAVDELRKKGGKAGLLKIMTYRPFPKEAVQKALKNARNVAVIEKAISPGSYGPVYSEISAALYEAKSGAGIRNFIAGLGGRDVKLSHIEKAYELTKEGRGSVYEWLF
ncbi:MAG: pyruvate ferredoxin oxidoreductase [Candidatus Altiarchaeota archaeon]|nr:pyruvate ferredoxin oxidoreductase [Candidatus Altiarchaeota archaeon]